MTTFTIDWDATNIDGANELSIGDSVVDVDVSTPSSVEGSQWFVSTVGGDSALRGQFVREDMTVNIGFSEPVTDISFELFDVDANNTGSAATGWDDQITIIALDNEGNQVEVNFSDLGFHHEVTDNVLDTDNNADPNVEGSGAIDSVTVNIPGPIVSLQIVYDNDDGIESSGVVGISDITFVSTFDGYVEGTSAGETIDLNYVGDPDGDRIDNNDALLPGELGQDDIVLAGGGDDIVLSGDGDDLVIGSAGEDEIEGGAGNDVIYGDSPTYNGDVAGPLDFDSLSEGDIVSNQFITNGVRISSADEDNPVMVFDSGAGTGNASGQDPDLLTPSNGNILILSEDRDASDPDDNAAGGTFIFEFTGAATVRSLDFIDQGSGVTITLFDEDGGTISTINVPAGADNTVLEQVINVSGVFRMEVNFLGSGAIDNLDFTIANSDIGNDDIIDGGIGDDLVFGQRGDDIIDGDDGNDDLRGGRGNDIIRGGDDDDILRGNQGNDTLEGGDGVDDLRGGGGNDILRGGDGADVMQGGTGNDTFEDLTAGDVVVGGEDGDGNDIDTLDISNLAFSSVDYTVGDPESGVVTLFGGGTITFSEIENVILCFTPGTMIATPKGEVPVEKLKMGDRVLTRDNGIQTISWCSAKRLDHIKLKQSPEMRPITIKAGALGNSTPERDMTVSPMHRMLIVSEIAQLYFDQAEVLIPAKHLLNLDGVEVSETPYVTYIHFMCDKHELVLADGAWSESFQPGDYSLQGLDEEQRAELFALFPELKTKEGVKNYGAARMTLRSYEAQLLTNHYA